MDLKNIDPATIAKSRQILGAFGQYWGKQLYSVEVSSLDADYNEDVANNKNTLRKPLRFYVIKTYNILGGELTTDANGEPVIQFNGDSDLRFPLLPPQFVKAQTSTVADAVAAWENKKSIIFFDERIPLQKEVNALNKGVQKIAEDLAKKYTRLSGVIVDVMRMEESASREYFQQCGIDAETGEKLIIEVTV